VTGDGQIVSSADASAFGTRDERLGKLVAGSDDGSPELRPASAGGEPTIEVWCAIHRHGYALGLVGGRRIQSILERVAREHRVKLTLVDPANPPPAPPGDVVTKTMKLDEVDGLVVNATVPRESLTNALARLDREILENGAVAVLVALALAIILARSLAKPLRELAHETREVMKGEPRPVRRRGSKEIRELADTFNQTIEEIGRIKKRLAATERIAARREIARQVAHAIKNPLAPIRAAVETLRRLRNRGDAAFDDYFDEATKTVLEEVHRIANIVGEFTKFSRLPPPKPELMDLVAAGRRVLALHAADPEAVKTGAKKPTESGRVELVAEDDVPEVMADRDQLVQVLTNLVQNGLDAASTARPDPRVSITIGRLGEDRVRIVVRDNGPGVADEMRDKLFEPYATSKPHGTGLGLAICQRIVVEHGGDIGYRPATKGGAVFEITLPIAGPSLLEKSMEISSQPTSRFES
jgi:signal transduction histidine kinase